MNVVVILLIGIIGVLVFALFGVATVAIRWKDRYETTTKLYTEGVEDIKRLYLNDKLKGTLKDN